MANPLVIVIPCRNDWGCIARLLGMIDRALPAMNLPVQIVLIDDASEQKCNLTFEPGSYAVIRGITVVHLLRNLGHQRAIAIGLAVVSRRYPESMVCVMDGDGEDNPEDISKLVEKCRQTGCSAVVFAQRRRRSEGIVFRACYRVYRFVHWLLTGVSVRFGNFSLIPSSCLQRLVVISELWNHYAAAVLKAKIPYETVESDRAARIMGRSQMDFVALVGHGLSAISVFGEVVSVRLLFCCAFILALCSVGIVSVLGIRLGTDIAVPGWATYSLFMIGAIAMQTVLLAGFLVFMLLGNRSVHSFIPIRDCQTFIGTAVDLGEK
jgi:polyisoprenyl-phosphate glycosyltransferase